MYTQGLSYSKRYLRLIPMLAVVVWKSSRSSRTVIERVEVEHGVA